MSYQVLARKWRPKSFDQLVGQEHVSQALINGLDQDRVHHAFLFTGTRGVGKTTIARILTKCLNCETGVSSTPCGECSSCIDIDEGRFVDMMEIDAASRTGVDDMRELLESVQYTPTQGPRYKVYVIDEVHMLSAVSSFNALAENTGGAASAREIRAGHHRSLRKFRLRSCHAACVSTSGAGCCPEQIE